MRKKPAICHQPPWSSGQIMHRPSRRRRRLEGEPGQLAHELDRIPVHRGPHVEPDDLEGEDAEQDRRHAEEAEVDRTDLRVADDAGEIAERTPSRSARDCCRRATPRCRG